MISSPRHNKVEPNVSKEIDDATLTKTNLKGDWINFFLLLLLYTMQGMSMGIAKTMPILLQSKKNVTYSNQAFYNLSVWPFSLKLLWAPLVDALYVRTFGRRKTWLIPAQCLIGVALIYTAINIDDLLPETGKPNVVMLTYIFLSVNILSATQDIAVDGWALTMLKKNNVGYASTCNASGQTLGSMIGGAVLILFTSEEFSNTYFRSEPAVGGVISLKNLLYGWGVLFILVTTLIAILKKEKDDPFEDNHEKFKVVQSYSLLWDIIKLPSVKILMIVMVTSKIGYGATYKVTTLKLIDAGISKEDISILDTVMSGVGIIIPFIVAKWTSGPKPMSVFLKVVPIRLLLNIAFFMLIYYASRLTKYNGIPIYYYAFLIFTLSIQHVLIHIMFVAVMSFYSRISDPRFGSTYMTLLNTVSNLSNTISSTVSLGMIDVLTFKECSTDSNNNCSTVELETACKANKGECIITVNGYYVEMVLFTIVGIIWYCISRNILKRLQTMNTSHWLVNSKRPVAQEMNNVKMITPRQ